MTRKVLVVDDSSTVRLQVGTTLSEAGFSELQPFWAVPDFRCPTELIPADAESIRAARRRPGFVQGDMRSARLLVPLLPARLIKYVTTKNTTTNVNQGDFYFSFELRVTNP